jgi:hypothetical protein
MKRTALHEGDLLLWNEKLIVQILKINHYRGDNQTKWVAMAREIVTGNSCAIYTDTLWRFEPVIPYEEFA